MPDDLKVKYNLGPVESWRYLNVMKGDRVNWDIFPCQFTELAAAMDAIPTVSGMKDGCWRVLIAIMCVSAHRTLVLVRGSHFLSDVYRRQLGNASFTGSGEDDALFADLAPLRAAAACLGCEEAQLTKALCTQNIKAGLDWIAKPNTTTYSQNVKDALSKVPFSNPANQLRYHSAVHNSGALLAALRCARRNDQYVAHVRRCVALLHRRRRYFRV